MRPMSRETLDPCSRGDHPVTQLIKPDCLRIGGIWERGESRNKTKAVPRIRTQFRKNNV